MDNKGTAFVLIVLLSFLAGCVSEEETAPSPEDLYKGAEQRTYSYSFNGKAETLRFQVYEGLNDYLANLSRTYQCAQACPSNETIQQGYLDQRYQESELQRLASLIKTKASDRENQAKIAINLVQRIPYDDAAYNGGRATDRYPYQVLYENKGVCGEKTRLLAFLLRDIGYGSALMYFSKEQHAALGLKCPQEYSYKGTGYCFIETTSPAVPTYDQGPYPVFGKLSSSPEVLKLSDGDSYDDIGQEYRDALEWGRLQNMMQQTNGVLDETEYGKWKKLAVKYGIEN